MQLGNQKKKMNQAQNKSLYSFIYDILNNRDFINEEQVIYHYTSMDALHNILATRCFHFTHYAFMNDYSEFEFGINCFQEKMGQYIHDD